MSVLPRQNWLKVFVTSSSHSRSASRVIEPMELKNFTALVRRAHLPKFADADVVKAVLKHYGFASAAARIAAAMSPLTFASARLCAAASES